MQITSERLRIILDAQKQFIIWKTAISDWSYRNIFLQKLKDQLCHTIKPGKVEMANHTVGAIQKLQVKIAVT